MALYGLTGAHLDGQGRIETATLRAIDGNKNQWAGSPEEMTAGQVAKLIAGGNVVQSIFIVQHGDHNHVVPGANFRPAKFDDGFHGIELEEESEGKRVRDLVLG